MTRLVVVLPLEPLRIGQRFAVHQWPLHVTVVAPFSTDADPDAVAAAVIRAAAGLPEVSAVAAHDEHFGRRHDVPVTVLEEEPRLTAMHAVLVDTVRPFASNPDDPAFSPRGFRPHVTLKQHGRVHAGDRLLLRQVAVVDMTPRSDPKGRSVLAVTALREN